MYVWGFGKILSLEYGAFYTIFGHIFHARRLFHLLANSEYTMHCWNVYHWAMFWLLYWENYGCQYLYWYWAVGVEALLTFCSTACDNQSSISYWFHAYFYWHLYTVQMKIVSARRLFVKCWKFSFLLERKAGMQEPLSFQNSLLGACDILRIHYVILK